MGVTLVYNPVVLALRQHGAVIAQKDFALTPALVGALSACDGLGGTLGALAVGLLAGQRTLFRFYTSAPCRSCFWCWRFRCI
jgi:hypothetical protein